MISPENKELLNEMSKTRYGVALEALLSDSLSDLNDVSTLASWDETMGRKLASGILKKIFAFLEKPKTDSKKKPQYE